MNRGCKTQMRDNGKRTQGSLQAYLTWGRGTKPQFCFQWRNWPSGASAIEESISIQSLSDAWHPVVGAPWEARKGLEVAWSNAKFNFEDPCTIFLYIGLLVPAKNKTTIDPLLDISSDDYRRQWKTSSPAVCCVCTPSTWGRGPSVPSSLKAKMGFKGISGFSLLVKSNLDALDPAGKFMISSKFSFWTDIPFSFGCFSKTGELGNVRDQK